jgi:hypothetical protein
MLWLWLRLKRETANTAHLSGNGREQPQFRFHGVRMLAPERKKAAVACEKCAEAYIDWQKTFAVAIKPICLEAVTIQRRCKTTMMAESSSAGSCPLKDKGYG